MHTGGSQPLRYPPIEAVGTGDSAPRALDSAFANGHGPVGPWAGERIGATSATSAKSSSAMLSAARGAASKEAQATCIGGGVGERAIERCEHPVCESVACTVLTRTKMLHAPAREQSAKYTHVGWFEHGHGVDRPTNTDFMRPHAVVRPGGRLGDDGRGRSRPSLVAYSETPK